MPINFIAHDMISYWVRGIVVDWARIIQRGPRTFHMDPMKQHKSLWYSCFESQGIYDITICNRYSQYVFTGYMLEHHDAWIKHREDAGARSGHCAQYAHLALQPTRKSAAASENMVTSFMVTIRRLEIDESRRVHHNQQLFWYQYLQALKWGQTCWQELQWSHLMGGVAHP